MPDGSTEPRTPALAHAPVHGEPAIVDESNRSLQRDHAPVTDRMPAALARASGGRGGERLFDYDRAALDELVYTVLTRARSLGATAAAAEVSESSGYSVTVRKGQARDNRADPRQGAGHHGLSSAIGAVMPAPAISATRRCSAVSRPPTNRPHHRGGPARRLARWRPAGARPARSRSVRSVAYAGGPGDGGGARDRKGRVRRTSAMIRNSDGASVSLRPRPFRARPTSLGFSRRVSVQPPHHRLLADRQAAAATCSATTGTRRPRGRASRRSGRRSAAMRPSARWRGWARASSTTRKVPVLFEAPLAAGAARHLRAGHQRSARCTARPPSCLTRLGKRVFPTHIDIDEDPTMPGAIRLVAVRRGGRGHDRRARSSKDGVVKGYFLSTYTGAQARHADDRQCRRLAQPRSGRAAAPPGDDLPAMLRKMGTGLLVTELMGQGVNYVTGDYSRGASGFWVENGRIRTRSRRSRSLATWPRCSAGSSPSATTRSFAVPRRPARC